jgi:hypothetical protein
MVMAQRIEMRHAARINVNIPTVVEVVPQRPVELHRNLAGVYERVNPSIEMVGRRFSAAVRDLSTNGAFVAGVAVPLLSRVQFTFALEGYGPVECVGWTLWRRTADCEIPRDDGDPVRLAAGFGVLFEAVPLEARQVIARLVAERVR